MVWASDTKMILGSIYQIRLDIIAACAKTYFTGYLSQDNINVQHNL